MDKVVKPNKYEKVIYSVYRRVWYGSKLLCVCDEVVNAGDVVLLKNGENIIGILPFKDFSYAIYEERVD